VDAAEVLAGLNPAQRQAVTHEYGPLLILAGAGSGKTRAITRRIAWLALERGVAPGELLAITFTNKAAREMLSRVAALVPTKGMWISTFHSMCARILRREIDVLPGYTRDFSIYDTDDRNRLLKKVVEGAGYDTKRFRPAAVGHWISDWKNRGSFQEEEADDTSFEGEAFAAIRDAYERAMEQANALDFDDLLLKVLRIFEEHPGVRDAYAHRFRHVLVDEYQDTNRVQYLLMRHLAGAHGNLAVCGDPDQSIYAWRGADVRNILDFETDFPDAAVVRLEQNYRSTQNILSAAQALIRNNAQRVDKDLWSDRGDGDKLCAIECGDENDEALEIARQVHALSAAGTSPGGVAVLYRANFQQRALERALRLARVPYQIVGGVEFYQRREVRDVLAYLKLLVNPADDVACARIVNVPSRGIGDTSLQRLAGWAADRRLPLSAAVASTEAVGALRGRAKSGVARFAALLEELRPFAEGPAAVAVDAVLDESGYVDHLAGLEGDEVDRRANVEELRAHAEAYDRESPEGGLRGFLQDVALVSDVDDFEQDAERVTLMTLHAAKGLEFPVVFVAGLEEELLPHARALMSDDPDTGVEEERRLLYVGMTRAQDRLFLTHARVRQHFGQGSFRSPSRFLDELPAERLEGYEQEEDEADALGEYVAEDGAPGLSEGDVVEHDHFGRGRVEALVGRGVNARATVRFDRHGVKQLLLQYARLRVVGRSGR
jgi:DNA helicase-2/ATP-dependent DNA helicase PcrA